MPRKGGKSTSPKKKEKMATGGVETPSQDGGDHDNSSHESEEDIRRSVKDGGASDKGPTPNETIDSLSPVMGQIGKLSTAFLDRHRTWKVFLD